MDKQQVILVDPEDQMTGIMEKMEAHEKGVLHRAFSIFIFNGKGEMLLQQRALHKYHSGGLWTNACCSHPAPGEDTMGAAHRRLQEELGFDTTLEKVFDFVYREEVGQGLIENEFDHVFVGYYEDEIAFNPEEVMAVASRPVGAIRQALQDDPEQYTTWFRLAFPKMEAWWNQTGKIV